MYLYFSDICQHARLTIKARKASKARASAVKGSSKKLRPEQRECLSPLPATGVRGDHNVVPESKVVFAGGVQIGKNVEIIYFSD